MCVALKSTSGLSSTGNLGINMMPGMNAQFTPAAITSGNSTAVSVLFAVGNSSFIGSRLQSGQFYASSGAGVQSNNGFACDMTPNQFWMNNGDSLNLFYFNGDNLTGTVVYSFTTITES